ncbi:histidine phosphatase superfamily [Leucosporidium creatinivorum]|uniref:Histidine phosphatase superfamily n=1 Tax=Leucosporidium creatinivorum TaxID=106004 RepID=A0A1Y2D8C7_9BASI|nr:histidine phosphatase superfamily [Leucosporidium creatinivorum]
MKSVATLLALAAVAQAGPVKRSASATVTSAAQAATNVGLSVSDLYPPPNTLPDTTLFPPESVAGYQQATPTGVEPFAIETAISYPTRKDVYPLTPGEAKNSSASFDISKYWGNLSPQYSVPSSTYGLDHATPALPDQCEITQVHLYFRHGARYPTTGAAPSTFASKVQNASIAEGGFSASGELEFLKSWTYKLGAELLTPFGRKQNFDFGMYGQLLNNFTEAGALPVFRTQTQDRMVKTMHNFAAGFFGVPEYLDQVNIELEVEVLGANASGAPYEVCPNSNNAKGSVGSTAATKFIQPYFNVTAERLSTLVSGNLSFTYTDVLAMMQLCSYETDALGYSSFCPLFTEEEFQVYEQYYDIAFMGNNFYGSPVSAAQGKAWVQELVSRLTQTYLTSDADSAANVTLDSNPATFPLNQSIYADAAHEVSILDGLSAMGLDALFNGTLPSATTLESGVFSASRVVPFGTQVQIQVLECAPSAPTKQIRVIVNDAVVPLTYDGCDSTEFNGLCAYDTVVAGLQKRLDSIDFDWACNGNYTLPVYGEIVDGLAPSA